MRVPENNSLKAEIEELLKWCKEAEAEYGENSSYFEEPVSEQEMTDWEEENGVKIPESYKEWLRFTGKCRIVSNTATFWGPEKFHSDIVPKNLIIIGEIIGDGEVVCFSKETGEFVRFFEGKENGIYQDFKGLLNEIMRMLGKKQEIDPEKVKMRLKKLEEIRRRRNA